LQLKFGEKHKQLEVEMMKLCCFSAFGASKIQQNGLTFGAKIQQNGPFFWRSTILRKISSILLSSLESFSSISCQSLQLVMMVIIWEYIWKISVIFLNLATENYYSSRSL